jgi:UPF0176 protein
MHTILLYYKYVHIENPEKFRDEQRALCESLGLKGRIIVSAEGINGTVEGLHEHTETYIKAMHADSRFADIDFKKSDGDGTAFPKLSIKARKEIVTLGTGTADLKKEFIKGAYISPEDLEALYNEHKDFVIIDMRNDYEHAIGYFKNSIRLPVKHFRHIPAEIEKIKAQVKDKKVVSVCTGGVRCEKATSYLLEQGFKDVSQLHGGMVRYLEKYPATHFMGSLYVFDKRKKVQFADPKDHVIVGTCQLCNASTENLINCAEASCHNHFVCCESCAESTPYCSAKCGENATHSLDNLAKHIV